MAWILINKYVYTNTQWMLGDKKLYFCHTALHHQTKEIWILWGFDSCAS